MTQPPTPPAPSPTSRHILRHFAADLLAMPHWQKLLLSIAALAAGWGLLARGNPQQTPDNPPAIHHSQTSSPIPSPPPSVSTTPWIGRVGISVILGFLLGWITRAFLKLTALIALVLAGSLALLSYVHILNVDMTRAANQDYHDASTWVADQGHRLESSALAHIPSGAGGFAGVFLGLKRKRRF